MHPRTAHKPFIDRETYLKNCSKQTNSHKFSLFYNERLHGFLEFALIFPLSESGRLVFCSCSLLLLLTQNSLCTRRKTDLDQVKAQAHLNIYIID